MCEVASFKNFENSLTTANVMTKTEVAPFYMGHGVFVFYTWSPVRKYEFCLYTNIKDIRLTQYKTAEARAARDASAP